MEARIWSRFDDGAVDLGARQLARVEERGGDGGTLRRLGRPVALVRHAHDLLPEPEGEEDLGGGGDKGADPHAPYASWWIWL